MEYASPFRFHTKLQWTAVKLYKMNLDKIQGRSSYQESIIKIE
jgi:hypothetical protein